MELCGVRGVIAANMHNFSLFLGYAALFAGVTAAIGSMPTWHVDKAIAAPMTQLAVSSVDDNELQLHRLNDRARVDAALAQARPPVPLLLDRKLVAVAAVAPSQSTVTAPTVPEVVRPPQVAAKNLIEADGYRAVRMLAREPDGRWRAVAMRGTTEVAVLVDDQGRVSSQ